MNIRSPAVNTHELELSVQFGCGLVCPDGWQNFDVSPTMLASRIPLLNKLLRLPPWNPKVRYGNIVQGLPLPDGSAARVYSDQVLEHLTQQECRAALQNVLRLLKPGGVFRFFVPDLAYFVRNYVEASQRGDAAAAHDLVIAAGLGLKSRRQGRLGRVLDAFGNSHHLWGWDEAAMRKELDDAGFKAIRRIHYRDSEDPMFKAIEEYSELRDSQKSLGMEARR